jgi:hypothetical protein
LLLPALMGYAVIDSNKAHWVMRTGKDFNGIVDHESLRGRCKYPTPQCIA